MNTPVILRILTAVPGEKGKMTVYVSRSEEKEGHWDFESVELIADNNPAAFRIADFLQAEAPTKRKWGA